MKVATACLALVVVLSCLSLTEAFQLRVQSGEPWIAYGNGTKYDVSKPFDFASGPIQVSSGYSYWYNPLGGVTCGSSGPNPNAASIAVCQKADQYYAVGQYYDPIWLMQPNGWAIYYTNGVGWRFTIINFVIDETVETPQFTFLSESPLEQYNLEIRGRCIGQIQYGCTYPTFPAPKITGQ